MNYQNPRIQLGDSIISSVIKLAEGNPGALNVLMQMVEKGPSIDPQSAFGPISGLLGLDTLDIYGSRVWMLYKDVCKESITDTLALLRAVQLGIITESSINKAINSYGEGIDVSSIVEKVKEKLVEFGRE